MKLELKHLAPYLPYGLKIQTLNRRENLLTYKLVIGLNENTVAYEFFKGGACDRLPFKDIKPILRPLSDLDQDVEINTPEYLQGCCYSYVQDLISQHFDVFGLIEKGLAIDINTL